MYLSDNLLIGANGIDIILEGFIKVFQPGEKRRYFIYKEKKLFTLFTLMEPYAIVAARKLINNKIELNFLDKDGNYLSPMELNEEDLKGWIKILEKLVN